MAKVKLVSFEPAATNPFAAKISRNSATAASRCKQALPK